MLQEARVGPEGCREVLLGSPGLVAQAHPVGHKVGLAARDDQLIRWQGEQPLGDVPPKLSRMLLTEKGLPLLRVVVWCLEPAEDRRCELGGGNVERVSRGFGACDGVYGPQQASDQAACMQGDICSGSGEGAGHGQGQAHCGISWHLEGVLSELSNGKSGVVGVQEITQQRCVARGSRLDDGDRRAAPGAASATT
ncbi:hypothetical protein ACFYZJ_28370 [Streptomyces sp. NPDC001848]|uniref:hypothetical protein n=1 Tax=Streptomyces sp. NPDC001848 TaxID=3364618 RepID=UPI0036788709